MRVGANLGSAWTPRKPVAGSRVAKWPAAEWRVGEWTVLAPSPSAVAIPIAMFYMTGRNAKKVADGRTIAFARIVGAPQIIAGINERILESLPHPETREVAMNWVYLVGRILFGSIFVITGVTGHFGQIASFTGWAASKGVPAAHVMVVITGIMIIAGGLSIMAGYMMEVGAWLLIVFLLATAFVMHDFWAIVDHSQRLLQQSIFLRNLSLTGSAMILLWMVRTHGYGPYVLGKPLKISGRVAESPSGQE